MPIVTTQSAGISGNTANPKPVTGFDYAGQPMRPDAFYNGRPEHMNPDATNVSSEASTLTRLSGTPKKKHSVWTPEKRAAFGQRMRNYWQAKRNQKAQPEPGTSP